MSRYFTRRPTAKGWQGDDLYDDERGGLKPDLYVSDHDATDTGLLDANGMTIFRYQNPCGFGKDDEW